jgi:hypothetical protein
MRFGERLRLLKVRRRALRAILAHARSIIPEVVGSTSDAIYGDPKSLAVRLKTRTDADRERLACDPAVQQRFREILAAEGHPSSAVPEVKLAFESQETIDRDWSRNWRHTMD